MTLELKRKPVWLELLPLYHSTDTAALLIGGDGCQVAVPAILLLSSSSLVRRICADSPSSLGPIVLSVPTVPGEVLQVVGEIMKKGSVDLGFGYDKIGKIREVFNMLEVAGVLVSENFKSYMKKEVKYAHTINNVSKSEDTNDRVIEILVEIEEKEDGLNVDNGNKLEPSSSSLIKTKTMANLKVKCVKKQSFNCNECEYETMRSRSLIVHKRTHKGEKPFECDQCEYRTKRRTHLIVHKKIHTGEKRFACDLCEYRSRERGTLTKHKKIHTDERPFECNQCEYKGRESSNLIVHKRKHTGEKPFLCDKCEYSAQRRSRLIIHKRIHTGERPFKCDLCEYRAKEINNLILHKRIHTGEKPYECDQCEYKGTHISNLKSHIKRNH